MSATFDYRGRRVFITGGSTGIGAALVQAFAQSGAAVAFTYRTNRQQAEELVRQTTVQGQRVVALALDLGDAAAVVPVTQQAIDALGGLDIVINNAADTHYCNALEMTLENWNNILVRSCVFVACSRCMPCVSCQCCYISPFLFSKSTPRHPFKLASMRHEP